MKDDSNIFATVFGKTIKGPLFEIFFKTLKIIEENDLDILQKDGTRKT